MTPPLNFNKLGVALLSAALVTSVAHAALPSLARLVSFNSAPPIIVIVVGVFYGLQGLLIFLIAKGKDLALLTLIVWYLFCLPMRFMPVEEVDSLASRLAIIQWPAVSAILQAIGLICVASHRRILAGMIVGCLLWVSYIVMRFPAALDTGLILALPLYVAVPCGLSALLGLVLNTKHLVKWWHFGGLLPSVVMLLAITGVYLLFQASESSPSTEFEKTWMIVGVLGLLFTVVNWPDPSRVRGITNDGGGQKTAK